MNNDKPMYGLWIVNQGWLRSTKDEDVISFDDYSFAIEVSKIIKAKVRRIDSSWKDLEQYYLAQEAKGRSLWHTFKIYFQRNNSK